MTKWRARIGYLSPSVFEVPSDWSRILPSGLSLVATGLNVRAHTPEEFDRAIRELESALSVFTAEEVDIILVAGIMLATQRGYQAEGAVIRSVSQRLGIPVGTVMSANVAALRNLNAKKVIIATAYLAKINQALQRYFADAGFQVAGMKGLDVVKPVDLAKLPEDASYNVARALFHEHPDVDAVLIHGRWHSLGYVEKLEHEIARPVVSSVAASLWWVLKTLHMDMRIDGCGQILAGR